MTSSPAAREPLRDGAYYRLPSGVIGRVGRCRSCGAEVVFARNPYTGKVPPYDPDGAPHFASCPDADEWRGRGKER
jgi:hypothetical protein